MKMLMIRYLQEVSFALAKEAGGGKNNQDENVVGLEGEMTFQYVDIRVGAIDEVGRKCVMEKYSW